MYICLKINISKHLFFLLPNNYACKNKQKNGKKANDNLPFILTNLNEPAKELK